jgi:hypothetical protein
MDKTTFNIWPSQQALNAIACMGNAHVTDKKQLLKMFRTFAMNTKYKLMTVFADDAQYIPASPKCKLERFVLRTPDHASIVAVISVHVAMGLVQYSFNPSQLTGESRMHLEALLHLTLAEGYVSLYRYGTLSVVEYAVDVDGIAVEDVVLVDTGKRRYTLTREGTTYCGGRRSKLVGVTYDKGAEIRLTNPSFTGTRLRHELRKRATDCTVEDWVESESQDNLFGYFIPVPRVALRSLIGKAKAEEVRNFGVHAVFRNLPSRKALLGELCQCRCEWANPDLLWKTCRKRLIKSLRPPELKKSWSDA